MEIKLTDKQVAAFREINQAINELLGRRAAMVAVLWPGDGQCVYDERPDGAYLVQPPAPDGPAE